jgi:hypothetical protein
VAVEDLVFQVVAALRDRLDHVARLEHVRKAVPARPWLLSVGALEQRLVELADLRLAGVQLVEAVDDHVVREHHRAPPAQLRPGELRR